MVAVFDGACILRFIHVDISNITGHFSDELPDYASHELPRLLCDRIDQNFLLYFGSLHRAVENALVEGIEDFDKSLLQTITDLFPYKENTDWAADKWKDPGEVHEIVGYYITEERFKKSRRAVVGSTALIGFINKSKENVWVASLGDSDAGEQFVYDTLRKLW